MIYKRAKRGKHTQILNERLMASSQALEKGLNHLKQNYEKHMFFMQNFFQNVNNKYQSSKPVVEQLKKILNENQVNPNNQEEPMCPQQQLLCLQELNSMEENQQLNSLLNTCQFIFNSIFIPMIKEQFIKSIKTLLVQKNIQMKGSYQNFIQNSQRLIKEFLTKVSQSYTQNKDNLELSLENILRQDQEISPQKLIELQVINFEHMAATMRHNLTSRTIQTIKDKIDSIASCKQQKMQIQNVWNFSQIPNQEEVQSQMTQSSNNFRCIFSKDNVFREQGEKESYFFQKGIQQQEERSLNNYKRI